MIIKCETDSNIKVLNNLIIISNKLIRNVLLIMSKYRVKFLNCIRRVARKYGEHLCTELKMVRWWSIPLRFNRDAV